MFNISSNSTLCLSKGLKPNSAETALPAELCLLSTQTPAALEAATQNLADHLRAHPTLRLDEVARTLQVGRAALPHRRAFVAGALDSARPSALTARAHEADAPARRSARPGSRRVFSETRGL